MLRNKIKCEHIFLDAGMTLIRPSPHFIDGIKQVLDQNGFRIDALDVEREAADAIAYIQAEINSGRRYAVSDEEDGDFWADVYENLVRNLGFNGDSRALGVKIYEFYQTPFSFDLYEDAKPALDELAAAGYKLAIISNFSTILERVFSRIGIIGMFSPFIVSAVEGCMKPDAEIFQIALQRSGADPALSIMVGDNPVDDVAGARSAGITPVLIDRHSKFAGGGVEVITSLSELPALLERA